MQNKKDSDVLFLGWVYTSRGCGSQQGSSASATKHTRKGSCVSLALFRVQIQATIWTRFAPETGSGPLLKPQPQLV